MMDKDYAINMHRKVWSWIAEQYKTNSDIAKELWYDVGLLKRKYVSDVEGVDARVLHNCYCCQYDDEQEHWPNEWCTACPIKWPSVAADHMCESYEDDDGQGIYGKVCTLCEDVQAMDDIDTSYLIQLSDMCIQIANLPEVL